MNGLVSRSVLRDFGSLHREIEGLFENVFGTRALERVADWAPRVETFVKDETLHVRADLPGVDPKAVDISVEDDVLTIRGERKTEHKDAAYREVCYGSFERRIRVPDGVDAEKIVAKYTNGVLEIAVPIPKPVSKKVNVEIADASRPSA